ncbi:MAG: SdiA-regulated domain-containing protein [Pontiellaceae bacterium]|nr:SdiA-regulated domain-containing protein [Pontiellaceae bacterium]
MKRKLYTLILVLAIAGANACSSNSTHPSDPYNLDDPSALYSLPALLKEISALAYLDSTNLLCVQDELGELFVYNLKTRTITKRFQFGGNGDYEGLAMVDDTVYVLRADGMLFEIKGYSSSSLSTMAYSTGISAKDNEGLCCDPAKKRLLIASKTRSKKEDSSKNKRFIHAFNLETKTLEEAPAFILDLEELALRAKEAGIKDVFEDKKKKTVLKLNPSAIGIHPVTGDLYLLSGPNHLLLVFDAAGNLLKMEQLDKKAFNQAEGITFDPDGTLYISNEGTEKKPGTILKFDMKVSAQALQKSETQQ